MVKICKQRTVLKLKLKKNLDFYDIVNIHTHFEEAGEFSCRDLRSKIKGKTNKQKNKKKTSQLARQ